MADTLDVNEIEQSAATRMEVAKKTKELGVLVEKVFPGFTVAIVRQTNTASKQQPEARKRALWGLPALEQVETVLREAKAPLQKRDLFDTIHARGGNVSLNTLSIYLSRYPQFVRQGEGRWSMARNGSEVTK